MGDLTAFAQEWTDAFNSHDRTRLGRLRARRVHGRA